MQLLGISTDDVKLLELLPITPLLDLKHNL